MFFPSRCRFTKLSQIYMFVNVGVHCALRWTGIPSRVYSQCMPSIPKIGTRSTANLTQDELDTEDERISKSISLCKL